MNINGILSYSVSFRCRSLPKLSSQDEEGGAGHGFGGTHAHFEPIPHDHDFCERVVINVSILLADEEKAAADGMDELRAQSQVAASPEHQRIVDDGGRADNTNITNGLFCR